ncbi:hypothetical protein K9857_21735 [Pseudomonas sp. REP124]|uniref:hypothetical protein n=1 Tax=Pseudomonas sp. REP124 TaxID=2875731 RepID=UPI001CCD9833|nr:hypothetical protein [Pseudomonas sp. REP124]MBZ9784162.1 hypothetical protein [Pseudomonas sp. REP124]
MYIRMSQNCDKVVILKSVSSAVAAFNADGMPLKGIRKSTTVQIASFDLSEPITHPNIPAEQAVLFESWRSAQISSIQKAFIAAAAAGKLGGTPVLKTRAAFGDPSAKVGEFSGVIVPLIEVQTGLIKSAMSGQKSFANPADGKTRTLAEEMTPEAISEAMIELAEKITRFIHISGKKGADIYSIGQALDIRAAFSALGCATDGRGIGYTVQGTIEGRNAATEGLDLFTALKKRVTE